MHSFLPSHPRRPLSNAHIAFPFALIATWALVFLSQPCKEPPFYLEAVFATFTVCSVTWAAHLRAASDNGWRKVATILGGAAYDLFLLVLALVAVVIPIAFFLPAYQCYTPRAKVAELILAAGSNRNEISERFGIRKTLQGIGVGLNIKPEGRVKGGLVTADGVIVMASEDPPAVVIMTPTLSGDTVEWRCLGFPSKHMPLLCR